MRPENLLRGILIFFLILLPALPLNAQVQESGSGEPTGEKGGGVLDGILKAVGGAAKESLEKEIEEFSGTYEGRIGEVELLERRGNAIALKITYEEVKREDGVHVKGEVLRWGEALDGFSSTRSPIQDEKGTVHLKLGWTPEDTDSGWDVTPETVTSDQIRLSLVRETHPYRPFGSLVYDFQKTWTDSDEIEVLEEGQSPNESGQTAQTGDDASEAAIELAEDESRAQAENSADAPASGAGLIRPGMQLKPVKTKPPGQASLQTPSSLSQSDEKPTAAAAVKKIPPVSAYNFYEHADKARWKSATGQLPFPGAANDARGFAKTLQNGEIYPGNKAVNLLQTHPQWVNGGWIQGRFPKMRLDNNVTFKATGALLKGAENSDGVIMSVFVIDEAGEPRQVLRERITRRRYTPLEADLSRWAGKAVHLVLRVHTNRTSAQDWAVWVNPKLVQKNAMVTPNRLRLN